MAMVGVNEIAGWRCDAGAAPKQSRPLPGRLVVVVAGGRCDDVDARLGRSSWARDNKPGVAVRWAGGCQVVSCVVSHVERQTGRAVVIREESVEGGVALCSETQSTISMPTDRACTSEGAEQSSGPALRIAAARHGIDQRHFLALCITSFDLDNMWHMKPQGWD